MRPLSETYKTAPRDTVSFRLMKTAFALLLLAQLHADLPKWMAGSWGGEINDVRMEEHWTAPDGGLMLGMHRDVPASGKTSFEFLRIEKRGDSLVYLAMPGGRPATPFPLATATGQRLVFENPAHDFPKRILYWRDGERLCARVEGKHQGKDLSEEWCWSRLPKESR
jgi:Domain of unknown function (DUF6265)